MQPTVQQLISRYHIELVCMSVFAHYQFPLNIVPAGMPFILTSPFGLYATNGNVQKVYVSGSKNLARLKKRGVKTAELVYDPLEDLPPEFLQKPPVGNCVVFGRLGRPDNRIFDPISLQAFAQLEKKYGNKVRYDVVGAPPVMVEAAKQLDIHNIKFIDPLDDEGVMKFYQQTDVLAHARKDGETFGKAIAEAMLAGLPIITHKSHYHNEHLNFINESFAQWSEPDDVDAYYASMEWFVEHKDQIRPMGQKARTQALALFSPEKIMPKILETFVQASQKCYYFFCNMESTLGIFFSNQRYSFDAFQIIMARKIISNQRSKIRINSKLCILNSIFFTSDL